MIDLCTEHLQIVKQILAVKARGCEVRVFGSRVTGKSKPFSDLDLIVIGQQALELPKFFAMKEAFDESDLPFHVDVLDWHRLSDAFRRITEESSEII